MKTILFTFCALLICSTVVAAPPAKIKKCQMCHGKDFSGKKKSPSLLDYSYEEILESLTINVPRKMKKVVSKLSEEEKILLSDYIVRYSKQ